MKKTLIILVCLFIFLTSCIERQRYRVKEIRLIHLEVVEREYKQSGKRILREQRKKFYNDTIRIYRITLTNDSVTKVIELNRKPNFNVGDEVIY